MNIKYLKKFRKDFGYRETSMKMYKLTDHKNEKVISFFDIQDLMTFIVYKYKGLNGLTRYKKRMEKREKRREYFFEIKTQKTCIKIAEIKLSNMLRVSKYEL